ncbi:hypothetical protein WOLCODRAFT_157233 [Wolfiporia cocos MD-104 SS10]|uniref:Retrotransposon gag domain-containing protein n=1 Tax=Wolfiporia cocos (strain MD-104) TaxID=742152 RepID=A0A2H3J3H9_WOLCO|nr:hypothetical protein WOLCODRAFT_157233 [Wolfiporia cocos MD-104 SS10]
MAQRALVPLSEAPQTVHVNTWRAAPLPGTRASMWQPEKPVSSQWDAYSMLPEPIPDPRYKSKVREPEAFTGDNFMAWYMHLKLYIDDNVPLLYTDSKKVGAAILLIRGSKVDSWVTAFTGEHYLDGQWHISWSRFVWELHQKFNDPDLEKKVAVAAERLIMSAGKGEEYFQELERLLAEAKYDRENQVVHSWVTRAIPKDIYLSVHQAFVAATVNDKSQRGYNVQIPEDYQSWKQAILCTDSAMRRLHDEEKLRSNWDTKGMDKGKECTRPERPKMEPTAKERANLLKRKCHSCSKLQSEAPGKGCNKSRWHQTNWLTDGAESPKVLSKVPQEDFIRMVAAWAKKHLEAAKEAGFTPNQVSPSPSNHYSVLKVEEIVNTQSESTATENDEPVDGLYGLGTGAPILESVVVSLASVDSDIDDDDGASTCSDDSFVTALEAPPTGAWREANTVLNSSNVNVTYIPMDVDLVVASHTFQ